jgi:D-alanyl-D-alanine carboxypeptidase
MLLLHYLAGGTVVSQGIRRGPEAGRIQRPDNRRAVSATGRIRHSLRHDMNLQQVGDRLQALVARTEKRQKYVYGIALGAVSPRAHFQWLGASGMADPAAGRPMQAETPFLIASITKMYTAAAAMILYERGRLTLDDRIGKHLPGSLVQGLHRYRGRDYTDSLTVRHLISQTSGLPDYFLERPTGGTSVFDRIVAEGDRAWELEDVVRYTREQLPPFFAPVAWGDASAGKRARVRAHYSDTNFKLLGAILESVAGKPLPELFEEMFFEPLRLTQTYLYGHPRSGTSEKPAQVFLRDRPFALDKLMRSHGAEGGMVSTLDDTLRFGRAFMTGELFSRQETLGSMQQWNRIFFPLQYGYGLMRFKLPRLFSPFGFSPELVGHSGSSGSFLYRCAELDLYIAGTINQMALQRAPFPLMIKVAQTFNRVVG